MNKKWLKSKTLWMNTLAILVMITEYLVTEQVYSPEIHAIAIAVLNMLMRKVTNTGLTK